MTVNGKNQDVIVMSVVDDVNAVHEINTHILRVLSTRAFSILITKIIRLHLLVRAIWDLVCKMRMWK